MLCVSPGIKEPFCNVPNAYNHCYQKDLLGIADHNLARSSKTVSYTELKRGENNEKR